MSHPDETVREEVPISPSISDLIAEIDALLDLEKDATPAPWAVDSHGAVLFTEAPREVHPHGQFIVNFDHGNFPATRHKSTGNLSRWKNDVDPTLIVAARNTLPGLLRTIRATLVEMEMRSTPVLEEFRLRFLSAQDGISAVDYLAEARAAAERGEITYRLVDAIEEETRSLVADWILDNEKALIYTGDET